MTRPNRRPLVALALPAALALTSCGAVLTDQGEPAGTSATDASAPGASQAVAVRSTDDACDLSRTDLASGITTFTVSNTGSAASEVYVYAPADPQQRSGFSRIVTEKENIGPGTSYDLTVDLAAGAYEVACKPGMVGDGIRTAVTVTGADASLSAAGKSAVEAYRAYVQQQADATIPLVQGLRDAVAAGDREGAQALYAPSRVPWESVEPVAESFGDLDPRIDAREADLAAGERFTGWHRIEKALWTGEDLAPVVPVADRLLADVAEIAQRVPNAAISPASIGNGAKELLDEVATGKVTGEEEAFSHSDLADLQGNLDGADKAFEVLRPLVTTGDPKLVATLEKQLAAVDTALDIHRDAGAPGGFVSYDGVDTDQRRSLASAVEGLSEPLSRLGAAAAAGGGR